jgi:tetratricopeptide (TPR) repeat protein
VTSEGVAPPQPVAIELVCWDELRATAQTTASGQFTIMLDFDSGIVAGANWGARASVPLDEKRERKLTSCEIRAALAGFESQRLDLESTERGPIINAGAIYLRRLRGRTAASIDVTELRVPRSARRSLDKAIRAHRAGRLGEAYGLASSAITAHPKYAHAWLEVSLIHLERGDRAAAALSLRRATASNPRFVPAHLALIILLVQDEAWSEVETTASQVISLAGERWAQAYFYRAVAEYNTGRLDAAARDALVASRAKAAAPELNHLLGLIFARKGDYLSAAQYLQKYLKENIGPAQRYIAIRQLQQVNGLAAFDEFR